MRGRKRKNQGESPEPKRSDLRDGLSLKRDLARQLFVLSGLSGKIVAERIGVHEATISNWRKSEGWDRLRRNALRVPEIRMNVLNNLYKLLQDLTASIGGADGSFNPTDAVALADSVGKIMSAIDRLEKQTPSHAINDVGQKFLTYVLDKQGKEKYELVEELFTKFIIALTDKEEGGV